MTVRSLIGFGLGIFLVGIIFHFYNDVITDFFSSYILDSSDTYYLAENLVWNSIPFIVMFLGVVCIIFGGIGSRSIEGG